MTGCPNGCARPYIAEIGLVGKGPGRYNLYLGACLRRLAALEALRGGPRARRHRRDPRSALCSLCARTRAGRALRGFRDPRRHVAKTANGADFHANTGPAEGRDPGGSPMTRHIVPAETRPARLDALASLPIFLDLAGRRVVIAGGGEPVRVEGGAAAAAGARGHGVRADRVAGADGARRGSGDAVDRRCTRAPGGRRISTAPRSPIADADDEEAARFAAAARSRGALVNVVDKPAFCDFQFGAIVNRSPVVVSISTDGAAPVLARRSAGASKRSCRAALGGWSATAKSFRERLADHPAVEGGAPRTSGRNSSTSPSSRRPRRTSVSPSSSASPTTSSASAAQTQGRGRASSARPGRSGAADPEGRARTAGRRRDPLRPPRSGAGPRARSPRSAAHPRRQGGPRRLLPAGGHRCG